MFGNNKEVTVNTCRADRISFIRLSNAMNKMTYNKTIENKLNILRAAYEIKLISEERYGKHLSELYADCFRAE